MNIDLTPILQSIIALLAALVTYRLIPWMKARTTASQQEQLHAAVRVAVFAAEQIYGAGHGEEKFNYAVTWLAGKGYDVDRTSIEAAVYSLLNQFEDAMDKKHIEHIDEPAGDAE